MTVPIPPPATRLTPEELRMTPDRLHQAATECRAIAQDLRTRGRTMATANAVAAAANPATALGRATTVLCGDHLTNTINNLADFLDLHAGALDDAAVLHGLRDDETAVGYHRAQGPDLMNV